MAANEFGIGAASVLAALAGGAAAVGIAVGLILWRRHLLSIAGFVSLVGVAIVGGLLLAILAPTSRPAPPASAPAPAALGQRADTLLAQTLAPNSPLACIDATAGDQLEAACEAVLFGRPETIAAAVAYVTAKVALVVQSASGPEAANDRVLALFREHLAVDRYGIVAHVLATTAGCSAERCDGFALVNDASRIRANLKDGTFDRLVASHAAGWPAPGNHAPATADTGAPAPTGKPVSSRYDFPSAASIPPVSIMVPEEPRGGAGNPAGTSKAVPEPRPAARPSRAPAAAAPAGATPASPLSGTTTVPARSE